MTRLAETLRELAAKAGRFCLRTLLRIPVARHFLVLMFVPEVLEQARKATPGTSRLRGEMATLQLLKDPTPMVAESMARLAASRNPVIVGPWLGEVGFELLYWIPFLRWVADCEPELAQRMVILSRGGAAPWYAGLGTDYVDAFEFITPEELVAELHSATEAKQKQIRVSSFDSGLIDAARSARGLEGAEVLHPSAFFRLFRHLRLQEAVPRIQAVSRYEALPAPPLGALEGVLPDDYVVARFYFSYAFPDTPENRAFVQATLQALAERTTVVVVNLPFRVDEHADFGAGLSDRVVRIDHLMTPQGNLGVQTAAIAGAQAFVGTYGGFSYLAPYLGVPSLSWYSRPDHFLPAHLDLAGRIFARPPFGDFLALDTAHAALLAELGPTGLLGSLGR